MLLSPQVRTWPSSACCAGSVSRPRRLCSSTWRSTPASAATFVANATGPSPAILHSSATYARTRVSALLLSTRRLAKAGSSLWGWGGCHRDVQRQMYFCITVGIGGGDGGSLALSVCAIKTPIASTSRSTVCYPSVPPQHHSPRLWLQTERLPLPLPRPPAHSGGSPDRPFSHTGCGNLSGVLWVSPRPWPHIRGYFDKGSLFYPVWPLSHVQTDLELLENSTKLCFTVCV